MSSKQTSGKRNSPEEPQENKSRRLTGPGVELKARDASTKVISAIMNIQQDLKSATQSNKRRPTKALMNNIFQQTEYIANTVTTVDSNFKQFGTHRSSSDYVLARAKAAGEKVSEELFDFVPSPPPSYTSIKNNTKSTQSSSTTRSSSLLSPNKKSSSSSKTTTTKKKDKHADVLELPPPASGKQYSVSEACDLYINFRQKGFNKTDLVDKMFNDKLIPVKRARFLQFLKKHKNNVLGLKWSTTTGRPPILPYKQIPNVFTNKNTNEFLSFESFGSKLNDSRKQTMESRGLTSKLVKPVGKSAKYAYRRTVSCSTGVTIRKSVCLKTIIRYIAECSLLSMITYLFTIVTTHFIVLPKDHKLNSRFPKIDEATDGAKELYRLVQRCNPGMQICPVNPTLLFSTDDTTLYIFKGTEKVPEKWYLCTNMERADSGSYSAHITDKKVKVNLNGLRIRLTFTMSARGYTAPVFLTVYGLSERDLPVETCPEGRLYVKIPGLNQSSAHNTYDETYGFICFMRQSCPSSEESYDKLNFTWYRIHVLHPWIIHLRKKFFKQNDSSKPDLEYICVAWSDGCGTQLASIVDEKNLDLEEELRITTNKHSRARTTVEQSCDGGTSFRDMKSLNKRTTTDKNDPNVQQLEEFFKDLENKKILTLKANKKESIIDFICSLPDMLSKACTKQKVKAGFITTGQIDEETGYFPDLRKIMATCKHQRVHDPNVYELIKKNFSQMYEEQMLKGELTDEFLLKSNVPQDIDEKGNEVARPGRLSNEKTQRAKQVSKPFQRDMRKKLKDQIQTRLLSIRSEYKKKVENYLRLNNEAEEKVKQKTSSFSEITPQILWDLKVNVEQLRAACYVRVQSNAKSGNQFSKLNKGKPDNIVNGNVVGGPDNLLASLFRLRNESVKLRYDETDVCIDDNETNETNTDTAPVISMI